jgi:hypothetical protein
MQTRIEELEWDAAEPMPNRDGMDGTARLCRALYGRKERPADYLMGSDARMLHDAADTIARLRAAFVALGYGDEPFAGPGARDEDAAW